MENKFTPELIEKARQAKSPEEILALAKGNEIELTEDDAKAYFEQLHKSGELSDDELDNVSGCGCGGGQNIDPSRRKHPTNYCSKFQCKICNKIGSDGYQHVCLPRPPEYPKYTENSICMNCVHYSEENSPFPYYGVCYHPSVVK